jgi:hypothetical protein
MEELASVAAEGAAVVVVELEEDSEPGPEEVLGQEGEQEKEVVREEALEVEVEGEMEEMVVVRGEVLEQEGEKVVGMAVGASR